MIGAAHDRRPESRAPAVGAAMALHLIVFLLAAFLGRSPDTPGGTAVPITIISHAPTTDSRRAEKAPETQAAQSPQPLAQAPPPEPPPAPAKPAPPTPRAVPIPSPKATPNLKPPKPHPRQADQRPSPDTFSLDALAAEVAKSRRASPPRPAFANRGPARAETAPVARVDAGQGVSQSDVAGLSQLLERLWNPNCDAAGGDTVVVPARFSIGDDGRVAGRVGISGQGGGPAFAAAARRAIDAIHQAEPYGASYRGKTFTVNFDAKTACASR